MLGLTDKRRKRAHPAKHLAHAGVHVRPPDAMDFIIRANDVEVAVVGEQWDGNACQPFHHVRRVERRR
jgi:hypothetical protein